MTPEMPPITNWETRPTAKSMGVVKLSWPPHIVDVQFKIFTPVGTAISIVLAEKTELGTGPSPTVNMWWTQTPKPRKAIVAVA